ncbi:cation:proton antiporter [Rhodococcus sp. IEGM 1379]|uniref:cation:proton antiporter n=1 Tax=Rhodococcus sp. IEGM 1379 TaxID=3047086 RepID=UPI0024B7F822|nr:cation:proton antiporter [Rhodococcus sp. IEGM 1379]MDI9913911.1 cation:proton antiporter [Rhodococcus sp. IEGM 1379]
MTFGFLALVALAGLLGPLLAARLSWHVPVVVGELAAGGILGVTGFGLLDSSDRTFTFLADIGFALTMLVAGSHVPVRDPEVRAAIGKGAGRAVVVGALAALAGFGVSTVFDTGHAALYAVLIASSSAALILPIVDSLALDGTSVLQMTAQVAIADTVCIVALPLVIDPGNAVRAAVGALVVTVAAAAIFFVLRALHRSGDWRRLHKFSEKRKFALELRINLVILFSLAALAASTHVSVMLAGFAFGLILAAIGEPRRLAKQLFAITDGFFAPLFFVWLGASINLRDLVIHPSSIALGVALGGATLIVHSALRATGLPLSLGVLSAAQLGVPVAAVTVGSQLGVLGNGEPAAILLGALITVGAATLAGSAAARAGLTASS